MKFEIQLSEIVKTTQADLKGYPAEASITQLFYDTRLFDDGRNALFCCLTGKRKGIEFVQEAYEKGCRFFLIDDSIAQASYPDAYFLLVPNVLSALQSLAIAHRKKFNIPVIGIAGSYGKTMVKEWLYYFLRDQYRIIRSPKSYNSQLGVALSVLQMNSRHELAIFEAGISKSGEMQKLAEMIQPSLGVFTGLGPVHDDGFDSRTHKLQEKALLFRQATTVISENFKFQNAINKHWEDNEVHSLNGKTELILANYGTFEIPFVHKHKLNNIKCVLETLKFMGYPAELVAKKIKNLPQLAMRMEVIQGKNNNLFINDSYMMDGLDEALAYMDELASGRKKVLFIKTSEGSTPILSRDRKSEIQNLLSSLTTPIETVWFDQIEENELATEQNAAFKKIETLENAIVLFKGYHGSGISNLLAPFVLRTHPTIIEIKRKSLRNNLTLFKRLLKTETKLMVMVKAAAYGAGAFEMSSFLEREGIDYLGVAFPDEGVALRKQGVSLPIMVMNTHEHSFYDIIKYDLEPAIFSVQQLDSFTAEIIRQNKTRHAIHIKLETGMNRLGFREEDLDELADYLASQPEIIVKSVYSHLAESGNADRAYTERQLSRFNASFQRLEPVLPSSVMKHICNTDGIINYPQAHFDMVRLGIGLFGYANLPGLEEALSIKTKISKINPIEAGESLGYDRSFIAEKPMKIAVLPIGYADGFRRIYGNGIGRVNIGGYSCPIIGNVCMDMCFADISAIPSEEISDVELIGRDIKATDWAEWANTIPYEVITSLSNRLNRIWVE